MHLLVLILMSPNHPDILTYVNQLESDDAKAIAIKFLQGLKVRGLPNIPPEVAADPSKMAEVEAAVVEFSKQVDGRRREHKIRATRSLAVA